MKTPKEDFDPIEEQNPEHGKEQEQGQEPEQWQEQDEHEQEPEVFDTQVDVVEFTDHYEYKRFIARLEKAGYKFMHNVENDLVKPHLDHFKQTGRFKAITLVTVFKDSDARDGQYSIDKTNTAIWYLV